MKQYDSYKPSGIDWIGEIPSHWEVKKLKYVAETVQTGGTPPSESQEYFSEGDFNWFTPADFDNRLILGSSKRKITNLAVEKNMVRVFKPSSVLMVGIGATLGKIGICLEACSSNQQINAITFKNDFESLYGAYYLKSKADVIVSLANAATLAILNQSQTKDIFVAIPPLPEQTAIAHFLDQKTAQLDTLIDRKRRLIELLREEKTALINEAVTKGIHPDVEMKDSGVEWLGVIPAHWVVKKLKSVATKVGSGVTPSGGSSVYKTEGIPLLRSQNIHFDGLRLDDVAYITEEVDQLMKNSRVQDDDVLLNITGASIGRCYYIPKGFGRGNVNQHVCIIRPDQKEVVSKYLYLLLRSFIGQTQIDLLQTGANREGLNFEQLKNFNFPFPKIKEQVDIGIYLETETARIDYTISRIEREVELMQEYRTALISEVVTGKVRVL